MSFYANPSVIIHAQWYCAYCGDYDVFEPHDDGDRLVTDHRCEEYDDDSDDT